jgi:hypothetical protein
MRVGRSRTRAFEIACEIAIGGVNAVLESFKRLTHGWREWCGGALDEATLLFESRDAATADFREFEVIGAGGEMLSDGVVATTSRDEFEEFVGAIRINISDLNYDVINSLLYLFLLATQTKIK